MHQVTLDPKAAGQFAGVASTMNMVGDALRMMPVEEQVANQLRFAGEALATMPTQDGKRDYFTVKDWCANRKGWIFLPNPAVIREALRPLQSMWADMIMLGLMKEGNRADLPRVWLIYDEVDSLNTLPQLHTAITEMRSAGNPIVLGLQNMAQLEDRYGRQAETIFSQPYTKIVFATSHGKSAETLSKLIGDCEYVRYREVRTGGLLGGQDRNSFSGPEEVRKPLLLPSEIQSLRDLEGYVMQRGRVVKFKLPYSKREETTRGWIERIIPPEERLLQPAPVEADPRVGWTGTLTNPPGRTSDAPSENKVCSNRTGRRRLDGQHRAQNGADVLEDSGHRNSERERQEEIAAGPAAWEGMNVLTIAKLGAETAHNYYKQEFTAAANSYFAQDGQVYGQWSGAAAEKIGSLRARHAKKLSIG